jgi:hypothetical protein
VLDWIGLESISPSAGAAVSPPLLSFISVRAESKGSSSEDSNDFPSLWLYDVITKLDFSGGEGIFANLTLPSRSLSKGGLPPNIESWEKYKEHNNTYSN